MENEDQNLVNKTHKEKGQSLLQKFDIPIEHLSYEYIGECTDSKELERIVRILRSGEEGAFPQLTRFTEGRLSTLKPESPILLSWQPVRPRRFLDPTERRDLEEEIANWTKEMRLRECDLADESISAAERDEELPRPGIRTTFDAVVAAGETSQKDSKVSKRLASCNYDAWDKYDADTELNRIELREEQRKIEAKRTQETRKAEQARCGKETVIKKSLLTGTELSVMSTREREKGNEAYRAGDYLEALQLYSTSIAMDGDFNAYNNRAMTHIKLKNYDKAVMDCNSVLSIDFENVKALLRRGRAYELLDKKAEALEDYEAVLRLEPENKIALAAVGKLRKDDDSRRVRLTIEEIYD
ncbi:sperm-associated antigen 1 [Nasonia vitripennis]|uniref:Sperm-associated antigen 1 n=1 Tax=Nasonia vitripennis TaxID=7425 RepID=A0A7M7G7E2_NASVI|nr:sperm-associated antigen 1 [Nasonia vitripennis]